MKKETPFFDDFTDFYKKLVFPIHQKNPIFRRLDGEEHYHGTRKAACYFKYQGFKWKVDGDTDIDKLKIAFDLIEDGQDPFLIQSTMGNKGECLIIKGQPLYKKKLYIYKVSSS